MIVSGSNDKTVRIWDAIGHPVGDPLSLVEACNGLAFRAKRIILATGNATHRDPNLSGGDLVRSWRGRPHHELTSLVTRFGRIGASVQLSGFGMSACARCDTRVNANDLWATDDPLVSCFPFSKVLGDISMDPEYAESTLCRQLC